MLTKAEILQSKDFATEVLSVPEWGGDITIRTMSGRCRDEFEALAVEMSKDFSKMIGIRARLAAWTICDTAGELLFTEEDVAALGEKNGVALDRVFEAAQRLNKISDEEIAELEKK